VHEAIKRDPYLPRVTLLFVVAAVVSGWPIPTRTVDQVEPEAEAGILGRRCGASEMMMMSSGRDRRSSEPAVAYRGAAGEYQIRKWVPKSSMDYPGLDLSMSCRLSSPCLLAYLAVFTVHSPQFTRTLLCSAQC
jgi:hypothetical protein